MATKDLTVTVKTENERLLYKVYIEEKAERQNLQEIVKALQEQIKLLQEEVETLRGQIPKNTNLKEATKASTQSVDYCTDEEELARETEWIRTKSRKKRKLNISPTHHQEETLENPCSEKSKKKYRPPPIIVDDVKNYQTFYDRLMLCQPESSFTIKMMKGESVKINANDDESYKSITSFLAESKCHWHSYENKVERPIRVMVKKLHHSCQPARIIEDLKSKGFNIEEAVNKLRWKTKEPLDMFMLTFKNGEDINKIHNIKLILGCKVEIHALKSTKLVPQCKKCQGYGHTQKYCSKEARCVKCTGKHLTKDCMKPADEKPKCVHCGAMHPANYRGCVVAKEIQTLKNKITKKPIQPRLAKKEQKITNANATTVSDPNFRNVTEDISYAQIVANEHKTKKNNNKFENKLDQILKYLTTFDERLKKLENSEKNATSKAKK